MPCMPAAAAGQGRDLNTLDIIFIGIMFVSLSISAFRGGIREVFSFLAVGIGFVAASNLYSLPSDYMFRLTSHDEVNNIFWFIAIFIFTAMLTSYIGGQLTQIVRKKELGFWNFMAGTAIGALRGIFVCSLLTYALLVFMEPDSGLFNNSKSFPFVSQITMAVSPIGPRHFREELGSSIGALADKAASEGMKAVRHDGKDKKTATGGK